MLRKLRDMKQAVLLATDGDIGRCKDFLFDDEDWIVRYMVADTGKWLSGRKVLISPMALGVPDVENKRFPVVLTRAEIENSPPLESDMPVSREYEIRWLDHHRWPYYWVGSGVWGDYPTPRELFENQHTAAPGPIHPESNHLRSESVMRGYGIEARDGAIGHVEDLLNEDATWAIRYLVVDTRNWLSGRNVIVSPQWVDGIDAGDRTMRMALTRKQIETAPRYDPDRPVSRDYEALLHHHYGVSIYW